MEVTPGPDSGVDVAGDVVADELPEDGEGITPGPTAGNGSDPGPVVALAPPLVAVPTCWACAVAVASRPTAIPARIDRRRLMRRRTF